MIKYYYPIPLIANFLLQLQWYLLMNHTYPRRFSKAVTWAAEVGLFALHIFLGSTLPFMSWIRSFYVPVLFAVGFVILYREQWQKIACTVAALFLFMYITEFITALFVYTPEMLSGHFNDAPALQQIQVYCVSLPTSAALIWLFDLMLNRKKSHFSARQWILCAAFILTQMFILFGYMQNLSLVTQPNRKAYVILVLLACVVMDVFLVQYVFAAAKREQLQQENLLLSEQIDAQISRYSAITTEYETVRHMRHDISKHLSVMESMMKNGDTREAERYIMELKNGNYRPSTQFCENPVADALLHSYSDRTVSTGPQLEITAQIPAHLGIQNSDLVCVLGNLLDNALEACPTEKSAAIALRIVFTRGCLLVSIDNPVGHAGERNRHVPELERGVGTQILNHLAQKYHGAYEASETENRFHAELTLMAEGDAYASDRAL